MRSKLKEMISSFLMMLLIFIIFEIVSSTMLPFIGLAKFRIPFNILVVLYLGFKIKTPMIAIFIFIVQYLHSFFTIEGWEVGTVAGILVCAVISYFKDILYLSSALITTVVVQLFQCLWFLIVSSLFYVKMGSFSFIVEKFWRFLPESLTISLMAPIVFVLFDRIWRSHQTDILRY